MTNPLTALSFGGGRQTTAMLILAVKGEIPRPDVVIFADTGCEWPETYSYIEQYVKPFCAENKLPFVTVARPGGLTLYDWLSRRDCLPIPIRRTCTTEFKRSILERYQKEHGITRTQIGFSADEAGRTLRGGKSPFERVYPLIQIGYTLYDCFYVVQQFGWPLPPKSACYLCCFQNPIRLKRLALKHPDLFERLKELERRAYTRTGYYLLGEHPITAYAATEQLGFDSSFGCAEGYCFR